MIMNNRKFVLQRVAAGLSLVIAVSTVGFVTKSCKSVPAYKAVNEPTMESNDMNLLEYNSDLMFDPNERETIINKIVAAYADAMSKGVKDITIEQWMDFYTVMNIDNIDPTKYIPLQDEMKTPETILHNFDLVNNKLHDDAMTSTKDTIIGISSMVSDRESAIKVSYFQTFIAKYNEATDKKEVAADFNKFIEEEFATEEYQRVESAPNIFRMKQLSAIEKLSINLNRIPNKDMSNIIFNGKTDCNMMSNDTAPSRFNIERTDVKEMLNSKIEFARSKDDASDVYKLVDAMELEIEARLEQMNLVYNENPSLEKAINDSKPTVKDKYETVSPTDKIVTNPVTGQKEIHVAPTPSEYEDQKKTIESSIEKENANEELKGEAIQAGAQSGYDKGLADGYADKSYSDSVSVPSKYSAYADFYKDYYKTWYKNGYNDGQAKLDREQSHETEVVITPVTESTTVATTTPTTTIPTTQSTTTATTSVVEEVVTPVDGYEVVDGKIIDKSTGLEVEIITANIAKYVRDSIYSMTEGQSYTRTRI